jgi:site-specific recombinase XerD
MSAPATRRHAIFEAHIASKRPTTRATYLRGLQRLEAWAEREARDPEHLQTADLERFLAEEARQYARSSINVRRAALRTFYQCLHEAGLVDNDPTHQLERVSTDHLSSSQPIAYLTDADLGQLRTHAEELGPTHSLTICLLHETPLGIAGIARLSVDDLAENPNHKTYVLVGRTVASKTPWPISDQTRRAIDALRTNHARLISPLTKNPNLLKVQQALEQTRVHSRIEIADLAAALKGTQRRKERELCEELRVQPRRLAEYARRLLPNLTPLSDR